MVQYAAVHVEDIIKISGLGSLCILNRENHTSAVCYIKLFRCSLGQVWIHFPSMKARGGRSERRDWLERVIKQGWWVVGQRRRGSAWRCFGERKQQHVMGRIVTIASALHRLRSVCVWVCVCVCVTQSNVFTRLQPRGLTSHLGQNLVPPQGKPLKFEAQICFWINVKLKWG